MYNDKLLTLDRLQYIITNCNKYIDISSDTLKYIVEHGEYLNEVGDGTLLHSVYVSRNSNLIKDLIELGADINKENSRGDTLFFYICKYGNVEMIKYFIEHRADLSKENDNSETPLFACEGEEESKAIVEYLIELEANVNKKNKMVILNYIMHIIMDRKQLQNV